MTNTITIQPNKTGELVVDSRLVAEQLGVKHKNLLETIKKHQTPIERAFGAIEFQRLEFKTAQGNQSAERFALLTETQAITLMAFSRNTEKVLSAQTFITKEFLKARNSQRAVVIRKNGAGDLVIDSRIMAERLGVQHKNILQTIRKYQDQLEQKFGAVSFKCREFKTKQGNQSTESFVLLDEGQAAFILTCSRNTPRGLEAKFFITQEFLRARQLLQSSKSLQDFIDAVPDDEGIKSLGGGFVYLIQAKTTNYCKIGVSAKPFQRLTTLQTGSPLELVIVDRLFSTEPFKLEAALHRHYSRRWVRGEWYDLPKSEIDLFVASANRIDSRIEQQALPEVKFAA